MAVAGEILVVTSSGQGHLYPSIELCKHLSSRNFQPTLIIPFPASSIPSSLPHCHPLIRISEIPPPPQLDSGILSTGGPFGGHHDHMTKWIESLLSGRPYGSPQPLCAIVDIRVSWSKVLFAKLGIPTVALFTFGACCAAMEYATWKARANDLKPGETRFLPGLPEDMAVSYFDVQRPARCGPGFEPPGPGSQPIWSELVKGSIALMMNTSHGLEGSFLDYLSQQMGKPAWGIGPLLPDEYWKSTGSVLRDRDIRPNKQSSQTEEEVIQWLDAKSHGSVLYISFGSEVVPCKEDLIELASALEDLDQGFIWVARSDSGYYPYELEAKARARGLIINGWAPQLLILNHPSTGGFLTHCGWNSTIEAIGRGVPMLAWPIRGDQFYNAKYVASHLRIGHVMKEDMSKPILKDDIMKGIEKLMGHQGPKLRALAIKEKFDGSFPVTSDAAFDAFKDFLASKTNCNLTVYSA